MLQDGPSYFCAALHAVIVAQFGCRHVSELLYAPPMAQFRIPSDEEDPWYGATSATELTNLIFLSWLLFDLAHVVCSRGRLGGADMIGHHVGFILAAVICGSGRVLPFQFAWLICGEFSTPLLNLRWYLKLIGLNDSPTMKVTNALFAIFFFVSRVIMYGFGLVHLIIHRAVWMNGDLNGVPPTLLAMVVLLLFGGYALNLMWWNKVFRMGMGWKKEKKAD